MSKYINVKIPNKDCKGISLFANSDIKEILSDSQAKKLITNNEFKLQLQVRVNGKRGKKIFTFNKNQKTFLKALEFVASKRDEIRETLRINGTLIKKKEVMQDKQLLKEQITFLDTVELFLKTKSITARPSTIVNYKTTLLKHSKPLHNKIIKDINIDEVQSIINNLIGNKADGTIVLYARTLGAFFHKVNASVYQQWGNLSLPIVDNKVDYTLGLEDTKKIIYAMRGYSGTTISNETFYQYEEIKNIFAFLLTGRRINEVLNLKYKDINFDTNTYKIPATTAKGKKELIFNLDDYLIDAINSQMRLNNINLNDIPTNKRLFKYTKETPRIHFQNLLKSLGLPRLRLHDIRHMLASTLVQNKVPIQDISVMLGHSSIAITEARYANKNKDQATRATDALNEIIGVK